LGAASIVSLVALAPEATYAAGSLNLGLGETTTVHPAVWTTTNYFGDVVFNEVDGSVSLTNAFHIPGIDDSGGRNLSGHGPLGTFFSSPGAPFLYDALGYADTDALNTAFGVGPTATPPSIGVVEGSLLVGNFRQVAPGDRFEFAFGYSEDRDAQDIGFVMMVNQESEVRTIASLDEDTAPFRYDFAEAGDYTVAIGILDVNDFGGSTQLNIREASYAVNGTVIPTPALLPGLIGMGVAALRKHRNQDDDPA
jgi:hypothetical protein